jgi:hypothetical protein
VPLSLSSRHVSNDPTKWSGLGALVQEFLVYKARARSGIRNKEKAEKAAKEQQQLKGSDNGAQPTGQGTQHHHHRSGPDEEEEAFASIPGLREEVETLGRATRRAVIAASQEGQRLEEKGVEWLENADKTPISLDSTLGEERGAVWTASLTQAAVWVAPPPSANTVDSIGLVADGREKGQGNPLEKHAWKALSKSKAPTASANRIQREEYANLKAEADAWQSAHRDSPLVALTLMAKASPARGFQAQPEEDAAAEIRQSRSLIYSAIEAIVGACAACMEAETALDDAHKDDAARGRDSKLKLMLGVATSRAIMAECLKVECAAQLRLREALMGVEWARLEAMPAGNAISTQINAIRRHSHDI